MGSLAGTLRSLSFYKLCGKTELPGELHEADSAVTGAPRCLSPREEKQGAD